MKKFENDRLNEDIKLNGSRPSINWSKVKVYVAAATLLVGSVAVADDLIDNYNNNKPNQPDYSNTEVQTAYSVKYAAPSGYTLTYDENGNPICVKKSTVTVKPLSVESNGETKYYAPSGYYLTYDEDGNPVCKKDIIETVMPTIVGYNYNQNEYIKANESQSYDDSIINRR